jgi:hypothetical protein
MSFLPFLGVGLLCSVAAVHAPAADARFARFFQNVMKQPVEVLRAPISQYLGDLNNRFNLNDGPADNALYWLDTIKNNFSKLNLVSLAHSLQQDGPFSMFGNNQEEETLAFTKQTLNLFTAYLILVPEMTARATAALSKKAEENTNNALAVSSEQIHGFLTGLRTMFAPRLVQGLT